MPKNSQPLDEGAPLLGNSSNGYHKPQLIYNVTAGRNITDPATALNVYVQELMIEADKTSSLNKLVKGLFANKNAVIETVTVAFSLGIGVVSGFIFSGGGTQGAQIICEELTKLNVDPAACKFFEFSLPKAGFTVNALLNFIFTIKPILDVAIRSEAQAFLRNDPYASTKETAVSWRNRMLTALFSGFSALPGLIINIRDPLGIPGAICGIPANVEGIGAFVGTARPPEQSMLVDYLHGQINKVYACFSKNSKVGFALVNYFYNELGKSKEEFKISSSLTEKQKEAEIENHTSRFLLLFILSIDKVINQLERSEAKANRYPYEKNSVVVDVENNSNGRLRNRSRSPAVFGTGSVAKWTDGADLPPTESLPRAIFRNSVLVTSTVFNFGSIASAVTGILSETGSTWVGWLLGTTSAVLTSVPLMGLATSAAEYVGKDILSGNPRLARNIASTSTAASLAYKGCIALGWLISLCSGGSNLFMNYKALTEASPIAGWLFTPEALDVLRPVATVGGAISAPIVNGWATGLFIDEMVIFIGKHFATEKMQKFIRFTIMLEQFTTVLKHTSVRHYRLLLAEWLKDGKDSLNKELGNRLAYLLGFSELRAAKENINAELEYVAKSFEDNVLHILNAVGIKPENARDFIVSEGFDSSDTLATVAPQKLTAAVCELLQQNRKCLGLLIEKYGTIPDIFADLLSKWCLGESRSMGINWGSG